MKIINFIKEIFSIVKTFQKLTYIENLIYQNHKLMVVRLNCFSKEISTIKDLIEKQEYAMNDIREELLYLRLGEPEEESAPLENELLLMNQKLIAVKGGK